MTETTQIILIRHGQTPANIAKQWHGSTDTPLTEKGLWQADRMGEFVADHFPHCRKIYCSPLQRTRHTAAALANRLGLEAEPHPDLQEYGIGHLEGESFLNLAQQHQFFEKIKADPHFAPEGGESMHQVSMRMATRLREIGNQHHGETVAVVSHGAALALALAIILHDDISSWERYQFQNTSVSLLRMHPEIALDLYNSIVHLKRPK
jgi:probable phosphoglycerate mutase